ncbi:hypothetical protein M5E89_10325 [Acidaminococcus intestini]|nr:hypothetical protein M5E89_10325 [Acidaminococcus intestini]
MIKRLTSLQNETVKKAASLQQKSTALGKAYFSSKGSVLYGKSGRLRGP